MDHRYMQVFLRPTAMPGDVQKIHISLPGAVHKRLRVKVALEDTTIQDFVEQLVADSVRKVKLPEDD